MALTSTVSTLLSTVGRVPFFDGRSLAHSLYRSMFFGEAVLYFASQWGEERHALCVDREACCVSRIEAPMFCCRFRTIPAEHVVCARLVLIKSCRCTCACSHTLTHMHAQAYNANVDIHKHAMQTSTSRHSYS